ncbi:MAG: tRNA preQ1(34) S-adenosylmethionine ribosyltransferase-isomerase QueA [Candidatus Moranbacteria bacterium]|nr:tRNA preQ1(34) S-adenosylmethionine ribosyltransferase-isomerase QueA [Candidatus Moranbacteria bacterium]MDD3965026.1 tRNA preQ1(34) S-adenosylmethionine ribosyltransferase-isomerase QueA [Candidatus Moranbacteria bacterium]
MKMIDLKKYDYTLPDYLIRKQGIEPRDSARLFVYDTKTDAITFDTFRHIAKYLPRQSLVMLNNTTVLPARLWLKKETGGKIEVFVLANEIEDEKCIPVLVDRKTEKGQKLFFTNGDFLEVIDQKENLFFVRLVSQENISLQILLETYGETPLPHYLEGANISEDVLRKRYQTVFARDGASVAAPTASLHFTDEVFQSLEEKNIETDFLTLNVGLGTFAPLADENFITKKLHTEFINISLETAQHIDAAMDEKKNIIAVGTTALRTLESSMCDQRILPQNGKTEIFIYPPYEFRVVDILVTNFHLPKTSLMLLVDAFLQDKKAKKSIVELYQIAIANEFTFYSFGDSMLIL